MRDDIKIENIKDTNFDNISISYDDDDGMMMLFTPDMTDTSEHYHIQFNCDDAMKMRDFITSIEPQLRKMYYGE